MTYTVKRRKQDAIVAYLENTKKAEREMEAQKIKLEERKLSLQEKQLELQAERQREELAIQREQQRQTWQIMQQIINNFGQNK